jgi:hypothetical protein
MVLTYPSYINVVKSCSLQHESLTIEPAIVALTANHQVPIKPTIRPKGTAGTAANATAMGKKANTVVASSLANNFGFRSQSPRFSEGHHKNPSRLMRVRLTPECD